MGRTALCFGMGELRLMETIDEINSRMNGAKLGTIDVKNVEYLEKNARFMTNEMFNNLVENVKRDGQLTSVPLCWKNGEKFRVLSGNHRVKAAVKAGLKEILVLYIDKPLTEQEQIAIQLSHNAIEGKDDPVILKDLWDSIEDVGLKFYAGLDDKVLGELEKIQLDPLSEVKLDFRSVTFLFLPDEVERMKIAFENAIDMLGPKEVVLAAMEDFNRTIEAVTKTKAAFNVHNAATALMLILDIFEANQNDLEKGWSDVPDGKGGMRQWVPLASVFGRDTVPIAVAQVLKRAAQKMMDSARVEKKNLWQCLEYWAADYLAGA